MKQPCHNSQLSRNCQKHADSWRKTTFQFLSGIKISLSVPNWCLDWWVWYKLLLSLQHTSHKVCFCKENTPNGGDRLLKNGTRGIRRAHTAHKAQQALTCVPPSASKLLITFGGESLISWRTRRAAASVSPCSASYRWLITPNDSPPQQW